MSDVAGSAPLALHTAGALDEPKAPIVNEVPHPAWYIREEMDARDWGIPSMARAMGGDYGINALALGMYLDVGPNEPNCRLGDMANDIARAFDVSVEFIKNMEAAWLAYATKEGR